ncbi:YqcC family protein [Vibrio gallicus]|uniref:YqcC family protein n=1 Tax=Vibrio gallicus TaxID=190897 RepID=UPI0021C3E05B|nr:YqcC family protein [Vibrio gallicus]
MSKQAIKLKKLLLQLTERLQNAQLWDVEPPSTSALSSQQPFAVDTLKPQQWLQWVFIPRMQQIIADAQPIPSGFSLTPYFEEVWKQELDMTAIIEIIQSIDEACSC